MQRSVGGKLKTMMMCIDWLQPEEAWILALQMERPTCVEVRDIGRQ